MKNFTRLVLCMLVGLSPFLVKGQTAGSYTFSNSSTGSLGSMTGSTQLVAAASDDVASAVTNIGFSFTFAGTAYTQFSVNSNGQLRLGSTAIAGTNTAATASVAIIAAMSGDNYTLATTGKVHFKLNGTAPNRQLVVEYLNLRIPYGTTGTGSTIQIVLNETSNTVEFRYGAVYTNGTASSRAIFISSGTSTANVGYIANIITTMDYTSGSLAPTTGNSLGAAAGNVVNLNSTADGSRRVFTFTPPPPCSGTPTGGTIPTAAATQPTCPSTVPAALTPTGITNATGLTYQWETATDAAFTTPANATGTGPTTTSFTPAATPASFTAPIYYRLKVTCTASALVGYSTVATISPPAAPATQALIPSFTATATSVTLTLTAGSGGYRLVYFNSANSFTAPTDGLSTALPTAATAYTTGEQLVFNSTTTSVTVTGLTIGTTYYARAYEYLRCGTASPYTNYYNATGSSTTVNTATALSYEITRSTGIAYNSIITAGTGTAFTGTFAGGDDEITVSTPIGFNFTYQGQTVSNFKACTNGWMTLDATNTTATTFGNTISANATTRRAVLAPIWDDLVILGNAAANKNACMQYQLTGTAPNRVLTMEWKDMEKFSYAGPNLNFQVKLYETSNNIEYVYGNMSPFDGSKDVAFTYSTGMTSFNLSSTLVAGEYLSLQNSNTKIFAATAQNNLNLPAACYSNLLFTPGAYTAGTPNAAAANENCSSAITLTVSPTVPTEFCQIFTPGSTVDATAPSCGATTPGNPDDDVWFSFTPTTSGTVTINVKPAGGYDPVVQLYSGACGSLAALTCVNAKTNPTTATLNSTSTGVEETLTQTGMVAGTTYYFRVYHAGTGGIAGSFDNGSSGASVVTPQETGFSVSIFVQPPPPVNDDCAAATTLSIGTICTAAAGTTVAATASTQTACGGTPTGDVWYKIIATDTYPIQVQVQGATGFNPHLELWNAGTTGDCAAMTTVSGSCTNLTSTGGLETYTLATPVVGNVYYLRVYHSTGGSGSGSFTVCATSLCNTPTPSAGTITGNSAAISWTCTNCGPTYVLEYGLPGFMPGTGTTAGTGGTVVTITTASPYTLNGLTQLTAYEYYLRQNCGSSFSLNSAVRSFTTLEACPKPTAIATNTVTTTSANVTWTCATCGTDPVIIEYGATGFVPGTGATAGAGTVVSTTAGSPYALTGLTSATAYDLYVRRDCSAAANGLSANTAVISFTTLTACTTPVASTTVSSVATTCAASPFTLNLGTTYTDFGITYQWQTYDGTTGTNISGATAATYTVTTQTAATQYRCAIICAGGATTYSTSVAVGQKASLQCYCTSLGGGASASSNIANVSITGTPFTSNGTGGTANYTSFVAGATTPTLIKGQTYTFSLTTTGTLNGALFIDYDQSGTFDASEFTQVIPITPSGTAGIAQTVTFTVPSGATTGITGLRVRTRGSSFANGSGDVCASFATGETHDYLVNIIPAATAGPATCSSDATVTSTNSGLWLHLADAGGNVFASVLDNQVMGIITGSYMTNVGAIRSASAKNYMDRNLGVNSATAPTSNVRMRVYFTDAELQALLTSLGLPSNTALTGLSAVRIPGALCASSFVGSSVSATIAGSGTTATTHYLELTVPGFSGFYIAGPSTVLPIELKSLTATAKGSANIVKWTTATELNVAEFIIERSANGRDAWTTVARTKAAGTTQTEQNYQVTDNEPLTLSYYRLRSVETSGKSEVSKTVAVKRNGGKLAVLMVSPNPTTEGVNVDFSTSKIGKLSVTVIDILGKVVRAETVTTVEGANLMRLDLSNLAQGTYVLTLNDGETLATQRVVKQ